MAYLGNKKGPRESEIFDRLGPECFGISPAELEEEISDRAYGESREEIVAVHVDEEGRPYIELSSVEPGKIKRFLLEEHGYLLKGKIKTYSDEEHSRWEKRIKKKS